MAKLSAEVKLRTSELKDARAKYDSLAAEHTHCVENITVSEEKNSSLMIRLGAIQSQMLQQDKSAKLQVETLSAKVSHRQWKHCSSMQVSL